MRPAMRTLRWIRALDEAEGSDGTRLLAHWAHARAEFSDASALDDSLVRSDAALETAAESFASMMIVARARNERPSDL